MKLMSINVNGLKAFYNRGEGEGHLLDDLLTHDPDILFFNETKCSHQDYLYWLSEWVYDYTLLSTPNQFKAGYAGVGVMINNRISKKVLNISCPVMIESPYDSGRILTLEFPKVYVVGVYVLNSGDKDDLRKEWDKEFRLYLNKLKESKPVVILGDLNVCREEKDCWAFDEYFDEMPGVKEYEIDNFHELLLDGFLDSYRILHPDTENVYSWFSYRGDSRYTNKGFRLDYAVVDQRWKDKIVKSDILGTPCQYSDHSPIILELNEDFN